MNSADPPESLPGAGKVARVMIIAASVIGAGLLLFGGFALWRGLALQRTAKERTVFPVKLQAGETVRGSFNNSARLPLEVWLVLRRHQGVTDEQIDEFLLGTNAAPQIQWRVEHDGNAVGSGDSQSAPRSHYGGQDSLGRLIGVFKPESSGHHDFLAVIATSHAGLEAARPIIEIRPSQAAMKNAGAGAAMGQTAGPIFVVVGLVLLVLSWRERTQIGRDLARDAAS